MSWEYISQSLLLIYCPNVSENYPLHNLWNQMISLQGCCYFLRFYLKPWELMFFTKSHLRILGFFSYQDFLLQGVWRKLTDVNVREQWGCKDQWFGHGDDPGSGHLTDRCCSAWSGHWHIGYIRISRGSSSNRHILVLTQDDKRKANHKKQVIGSIETIRLLWLQQGKVLN